MLQNGKPVQSLWLGGERFDKYSQDDEDALAKYEKMQAFIGTTVHVSNTGYLTDLNITDLTIQPDTPADVIKTLQPKQDEDVSVVEIIWGGGDSVQLIGWLDVRYATETVYNDLCIVGSADIS